MAWIAPTAMSRLTEDILPENMQDDFPPENVSPAVVWLCTDDAKDVSGRQWLVAGNSVKVLSWQLTPGAWAETGSTWDAISGRAIGGPLEGRQLRELISTYSLWFAWQKYRPDTSVHGEAQALN